MAAEEREAAARSTLTWRAELERHTSRRDLEYSHSYPVLLSGTYVEQTKGSQRENDSARPASRAFHSDTTNCITPPSNQNAGQAIVAGSLLRLRHTLASRFAQQPYSGGAKLRGRNSPLACLRSGPSSHFDSHRTSTAADGQLERQAPEQCSLPPRPVVRVWPRHHRASAHLQASSIYPAARH